MQAPMHAAVQKARDAKSSAGAVTLTPQPSPLQGSPELSPTTKKSSMLARLKPRAPWRSSAERRTRKARAAEEKQRRMEAAIAMMAAGASTEDVDEMIAARAAMEAEME